MLWELHNEGTTAGPYDEAVVVDAIRAGRVPASALVRAENSEEWRGLRTHAPFAAALEGGSPEPAAGPAAPAARTKIVDWNRVGAAIGGGTMFVLAIGLTFRWLTSSSPPPAPARAETPTSTVAHAETPTVSPADEWRARLDKTDDFAAAIALAKPAMTDTREVMSPGAALLGFWGAKHGHWNNVAVARDETTFARVRKDPDAERGKRYCASGIIVQIEVEKTDLGKVDEGLLMDDSENLFRFMAFGSSGNLVQRSPARICGAVTGTYDYSNSGGGVGHAVQIVGMFDLPENRRADAASSPPTRPATRGAAPVAAPQRSTCTCSCPSGDALCMAKCTASCKRIEEERRRRAP